MNNRNIFLTAVESIRDYYAIGTPEFNLLHKGRKALVDIINNKLSDLNGDSNHAWAKTKSRLQQYFEDFTIHDVSYLQAPSMILRINCIDTESKYCFYRKNIVLAISLIANYYTLYYEEVIRPIVDKQHKPIESSVYVRQITNDDIVVDAEKLKKCINEQLKDYHFLTPAIVFKQRIRGTIPYGIDYEEYASNEINFYPLGAFIFGATEIFNNTTKVID